ncbi:hypothetical protein BHE74_00025112 [Ensete ventricosum]|nr:hypothetical protein BHE74_00025112 [Ensete ventricosum]
MGGGRQPMSRPPAREVGRGPTPYRDSHPQPGILGGPPRARLSCEAVSPVNAMAAYDVGGHPREAAAVARAVGHLIGYGLGVEGKRSLLEVGVLLGVADIRRKMVTKRSESEGNCDGGGKRGQQQHRLWLRCDFVAAGGVGCSMVAAAIGGRWGSDVHGYCGGGHQRLEPETVDVVFNLLLTAIKIVGSERLLRAAM